jgi:hypothetical protein
VAHIPKNLEGGEVSLTDSPLSRLEFKTGRIRLTGSAGLRTGCCSDVILLDENCRMVRLKLRAR